MSALKRSGVFITVLLSLFMFQSLWNVAAAFCVHEKLNRSDIQNIQPHFGHHLASHAENQAIHSKTASHSDRSFSSDFLNNIQDDHSDHLPSFAQFMVVDVPLDTQLPTFTVYSATQYTDWNNLYQSPHLYLPNPPPVPTPL